MKSKSIKDTAGIHNAPLHTVKEKTECNTPDGNLPVRISIDEESWKVWEKLSYGLKDKYR